MEGVTFGRCGRCGFSFWRLIVVNVNEPDQTMWFGCGKCGDVCPLKVVQPEPSEQEIDKVCERLVG